MKKSLQQKFDQWKYSFLYPKTKAEPYFTDKRVDRLAKLPSNFKVSWRVLVEVRSHICITSSKCSLLKTRSSGFTKQSIRQVRLREYILSGCRLLISRLWLRCASQTTFCKPAASFDRKIDKLWVPCVCDVSLYFIIGDRKIYDGRRINYAQWASP